MLLVGAACFYALSDYSLDNQSWLVLIKLLYILLYLEILSFFLWKYPLCSYIMYLISTCGCILLFTYLISFYCGIWLPIAGAYCGTVLGEVWIF